MTHEEITDIPKNKDPRRVDVKMWQEMNIEIDFKNSWDIEYRNINPFRTNKGLCHEIEIGHKFGGVRYNVSGLYYFEHEIEVVIK